MEMFKNIKNSIEDNLIGISTFIILIGFIIFIASLFSNFVNFGEKLNPDLAEKYGAFIGGVAGSLFTLGSAILFYSSIQENKKVVELQNLMQKYNKIDENINLSLKYKIELNELLNKFLSNKSRNPDPFQILLNRLIFLKNILELDFKNNSFTIDINSIPKDKKEEYLQNQDSNDFSLYQNLID